jgi:hypothetical protein
VFLVPSFKFGNLFAQKKLGLINCDFFLSLDFFFSRNHFLLHTESTLVEIVGVGLPSSSLVLSVLFLIYFVLFYQLHQQELLLGIFILHVLNLCLIILVICVKEVLLVAALFSQLLLLTDLILTLNLQFSQFLGRFLKNLEETVYQCLDSFGAGEILFTQGPCKFCVDSIEMLGYSRYFSIDIVLLIAQRVHSLLALFNL